MFSGLGSGMHNLFEMSSAKSRSISAENLNGEKGGGGMAEHGIGEEYAVDLGKGWKISPAVSIKAGETFEMANISGPGAIKHIWCTESSPRCRTLILRFYWENSEKPSIEVPLTDFFACTTINSDHRESPLVKTKKFAQVNSLPVCVNPRNAMNCYWEMPFYKNCRITVENIYHEDITLFYQVDYILTELPENCGYFHAQFRRVNPLPYKDVYTILDHVKGKGKFVGTYMFWSVNNNLWWGEGEIKFYLDGDKEYPTICGTGTEDYFCGAWDFDVKDKYTEFSTPYAGMPNVMSPESTYVCQQRFSMYRWHIVDPIYFDEDIKITIQALGWRERRRYLPLQDDISSVAFWYQDSVFTDFPELPDRDGLEII